MKWNPADSIIELKDKNKEEKLQISHSIIHFFKPATFF